MSPAEGQATDDTPKFRYDATLANEIEQRWQEYWESERVFWTPNRTGLLAEDPRGIADRPSLFVLDMFPYPSGKGLHVGHPLGFIATDVYARFQRMNGFNVLHAMGYDAFGLPAEQYAVQTGTHPRVTTDQNIATMKAQLRALGIGHDPRRGPATTDPAYYRWTQWIFLQIFNSWYDTAQDKARPIAELVDEFRAGTRATPTGGAFDALDESAQRELVDSFRLAYVAEVPVNWCPGLGTVLANEEVTADGRSERGNFPVYRRPLKQWMMRITAYADRLLDDLEQLDWTDSIKLMQRNWIGRSTGATVRFPVVGPENHEIEVFTTRPDTLFGATYMVLAPEHPLVEHIAGNEWPGDDIFVDVGSNVLDDWKGLFGAVGTPADAIARYREFAGAKSELERQSEGRDKTGVFTGAFAINPTNDEQIPIFVADYVLMGYGTGAIMAVPAHDQRDFEFAREFSLPIVPVIRPTDEWLAEHEALPHDCATWDEAFSGDGVAINSANDEVSLDGLRVADAKVRINEWLERAEWGAPTITYKLRDWLFSRQRYWGEPFPIVYDDLGPIALPEEELPVVLPDVTDFEPVTSDDPDAEPQPPLARATDWVDVELDLEGEAWRGYGGGARTYTRETNTMPNWAGSCWYYLRYLDPTNEDALVDPAVEVAWAEGARGDGSEKIGLVDLYVGGVEHAVLHLLYARFWHKVLFDLGYVSTREPFQRLYNQGYILAAAYRDARGVLVEAAEVVEENGEYLHDGTPVTREYGKMGKSLKNAVTPDDMTREYGADTLRLYEMFMGPLDASRPWNTADIVGVHRFLQRLWRNLVDEETGETRVDDAPADDETRRLLHKTIDVVRDDMALLHFNTAIARLFELNNYMTTVVQQRGSMPREVAEPLVLMVAPLAPHVGEELWSRLGHTDTLAYTPFPEADSALLVTDAVEVPVQIGGKVRSRVMVPVGADDATHESLARADARVAELLAATTVKRVVVVPGRLVNFVT
ncbi:MAG TPA: class I tRNA ligase family protein [Acidimicrobiia bacterium]|nr:class I tRNA ligase family protein [Acidimicrobiia bacterium]